MAECFLYRHLPSSPPRFYRVEIAYDLFDDVAVICEWGVVGGLHHRTSQSFANLREASQLADGLREDAVQRGYQEDDARNWLM
ncbi:WGR domain-containing protein [Cognatishimia sp.]|uniref:WGR domain-containing protein n=1 Tax=Cognatishimia sp. TaxID=2211648 RepID=UPI00351767B8|nr:WGR domain-containing protein [Cognatishimia sp.]